MIHRQVYLILQNVRSAYNVGSIFRTADGAGVTKIYLCGITPTPNNTKVLKTSLGAEKTVPWEYHKQLLRLLSKLRQEGVRIVALEQNHKSTDLFKLKPQFPLALIVGNEVHGISKKILDHCNNIIEIQMLGKKESLNVAVATGIALYQINK